MAQLIDNWVTAQDMVRSRAWRLGYESFRLGQAPEFVGRRSKTLAYEYGRLTAAYLKGRGAQLRRMSPNRPVNEHYVPEMAEALMQAVVAGPGGGCGP